LTAEWSRESTPIKTATTEKFGKLSPITFTAWIDLEMMHLVQVALLRADQRARPRADRPKTSTIPSPTSDYSAANGLRRRKMVFPFKAKINITTAITVVAANTRITFSIIRLRLPVTGSM